MPKSRSVLLDLLQGQSTAHKLLAVPEVDLGLAEIEPFPFLAIEGQEEMKLALSLALINEMVGGVLLIGSRGTAKTTAVRALIDLLPLRRRSLCPKGCTEEALDEFGLDSICDSCAERVGYGKPLTIEDRVRIVELPLNARLEDVVGGINERLALEQNRLRLERGILAQADENILYIDEVNLLDDAVADAILDAAAQGYYTVRRGPLNLRYRSRFLLIGSMNPEEGPLRPQIMDRFGLRAVARGLQDPEQRYRAYQRFVTYRRNPGELVAAFASQTLALAAEIENAKKRLVDVKVGDDAKKLGLEVIQELNIDSARAEISLFEAARAYCSADERNLVMPDDIDDVSHMALRLRESVVMAEYLQTRDSEDDRLRSILRGNRP